MRIETRRRFAWILGLMIGLPSAHALADDGSAPNEAQLKAMQARFAPVDVRVDVSALPANERAALTKMIQASRYVDSVFGTRLTIDPKSTSV